jgi:hypothetical protein
MILLLTINIIFTKFIMINIHHIAKIHLNRPKVLQLRISTQNIYWKVLSKVIGIKF